MLSNLVLNFLSNLFCPQCSIKKFRTLLLTIAIDYANDWVSWYQTWRWLVRASLKNQLISIAKRRWIEDRSHLQFVAASSSLRTRKYATRCARIIYEFGHRHHWRKYFFIDVETEIRNITVGGMPEITMLIILRFIFLYGPGQQINYISSQDKHCLLIKLRWKSTTQIIDNNWIHF